MNIFKAGKVESGEQWEEGFIKFKGSCEQAAEEVRCADTRSLRRRIPRYVEKTIDIWFLTH
jgi:hypothetical protein